MEEELSIYFIRHGETYGNIGQRITEKDDPLTENGKLEARRLSLDDEFLNM